MTLQTTRDFATLLGLASIVLLLVSTTILLFRQMVERIKLDKKKKWTATKKRYASVSEMLRDTTDDQEFCDDFDQFVALKRQAKGPPSGIPKPPPPPPPPPLR